MLNVYSRKERSHEDKKTSPSWWRLEQTCLGSSSLEKRLRGCPRAVMPSQLRETLTACSNEWIARWASFGSGHERFPLPLPGNKDAVTRFLIKTMNEPSAWKQRSHVQTVEGQETKGTAVQVSKPVVITRHEDLSRQLVNVSSSWWSGVVSWTSSFPAVLWGCPGRSRDLAGLTNVTAVD
jgi:hypothetical protein